MAQITSFTIDDFTNDGGSVSMKIILNPTNEEIRIGVDEDTTLAFLKEKVIMEIKRRNKLDTLQGTLLSFKGNTIQVN